MSTVITLAQLEKLGACEQQRELFKELFGKSVTVTEEVAALHAYSFDWPWAANYMLPFSARMEYITVVTRAYSDFETTIRAASQRACNNEDSYEAWRVAEETFTIAQATAFARAYIGVLQHYVSTTEGR